MTSKANAEYIKSINTKVGELTKLLKALPEDSVPLKDILKANPNLKTKKSIWDCLVNSIVKKPRKRKKPKYQFPMVMDIDGQAKPANEIINQYAPKSTKSNRAMDAGISPISGGLLPINSYVFDYQDKLLIDNWFVGYAQLSLLTQNGLLNTICTRMSEEMCRCWIEFKGENSNVDEDKIKRLEKEFIRLDVRTKLEYAVYLTFVFGACQIFPKLRGDEKFGVRETELFIDSTTIRKGDLEYISTIEPSWYVPIQYNTTDPFSQWFYEPELYTVLGQITHSSRMWKMMYAKAVNLMRPSYLFNGYPLMQQMIPYAEKFESVYDNITVLISRFNVKVLKTSMEALIDDDSSDIMVEKAANSIKNRIEIFNAFQDNLSTLALAKDEEFQNYAVSLAELDNLLNKSLELVAIIPGAPVTKLFGGSPQGMNATGEFEMRNWYDRLNSLQGKMLRPIIIEVMHCAMLNIFGEIDESITFEFCKLRETDPLEDSQIKLNEANRASINIQNGVITEQDERNRLINDPKSGYDELAIEGEDIENEIAPDMPEDTPEQQDREMIIR